MGHEHHFLSRLDRVSLPHVELALGLYRDHELLRFILADVGLPEGEGRVAISLEDPREGPFLVVTREGRFVTCLGKGMRAPGLPVVTRTQLDGRMARVSTFRAQWEQQTKLLGPDGEAKALLKRIVEAGDELSAEELSAMSALQPLLAPQFLSMQAHAARDVDHARVWLVQLLRRTDKLKPTNYPLLRTYSDTFWSVSHLTVLAAMGGPELFEQCGGRDKLEDALLTTFTRGTVQLGIAASAFRGIWSVAKLGKTLLPVYKRVYDGAQTVLDVFEAVFALAALGFRHSKLLAEVRGAIASPPSFRANPELTKLAMGLAKVAQVVFDDPERCARVQRHYGARRLLAYGARWPAGSPLRFEREEDVPTELAMRAAIHDAGDFILDSKKAVFMFYCLPWLARAPVEHLYLPREVVRMRHAPWKPEDTLHLLRTWVDLDRRSRAVSRPEGPPRKGPCPCGSGKKYKHCCEKEPA